MAKIFLFAAVASTLLISQVLSLRCYVCSSPAGSENDGCSGDSFDDNFLMECSTENTFCGLLKAEAESGVSYNRTCEASPLQGCFLSDQGKQCFYSCQTDGCNNIDQLPDEDISPVVTNPVISMGPSGTTVSPNPATTAAKATTSDAAILRIDVILYVMFFALTLFNV